MFKELAEKRRSIKVYTKRPVEAQKIDAVIEAAPRSPSGRAEEIPCIMGVSPIDLVASVSNTYQL